MVSDITVPHVSHLYRFRRIAEFKSDVEFLLRHFRAVTLGEIVDDLNGKRTLSRHCFHLTFDDGFRQMYDVVVPILQQAGVPATFFLNTAYLDWGGLAHFNALSVVLDRLQSRHSRLSAVARRRVESLLPAATRGRTTLRQRLLSIGYAQASLVPPLAGACEIDLDQYVREASPHLSSDQVTAMLKKGFSVGGHGHHHLAYSELPLSQQLEQTRTNMQFLSQRFRVSPRAFAFPHNDCGVERAFFNAVFSEPLLEVSFGTAGLVSHFHPRNLERVTMEKTSASAARILARQFARAAYFRAQGPVVRLARRLSDSAS
jgi:peptidoglycan/xylan/chitin deacetylase (PgdA/CDA1 family)